MVRLELNILQMIVQYITTFQFLNGAIRIPGVVVKSAEIFYFNSSMVRLEY